MQQGFPRKPGVLPGCKNSSEFFPRGRTSSVAAAFAVQREMDEMEEGMRISNPRTAEELIALRDQHWERFSDAEMNILFQHLRETGIGSPEYDEEGWITLQGCLRSVGIPINVFPNHIDDRAAPEPGQLSVLFHHLWTTQRSRYRKMDWRVFHKQLVIRKVYV